MTRPIDPISEDDLIGYVDNALTCERRALVDAHLLGDDAARRRIDADLAIARDLRRAFDGLVAASPATMPAQKPTTRQPIAWAASLAAALFAGGIIGWQSHPDAPVAMAAQGIADEALAAHRTFVVEVAHPVEVTADDKGHLATWLSNRLGRPFITPDLRVAGLELVGGRLLPSPSDPAAQLMYEDQNGQRLTLYLRRGKDGDPEFRFAQSATAQAFYWSDSEFGYALAGSLPRERLLEIAHLLQAQLSDDGSPI